MSEENKPSNSDESQSPQEVPPPPPIMPVPDIIDPRKEGPTYGKDKKAGRKRKKDQKRNHPLDPYEPLKKKKGCNGCCGCLGGTLVILTIAFLALVFVVGWFGPGRHVKDGYEVVNLSEAVSEITEAPTVPTCYIGQSITYSVPQTDTPIAIIGSEVVISGYFSGDVSLTGAKVFAKASTAIGGDLEVYAAEFTDEGITLKGELKGGVMKNLKP